MKYKNYLNGIKCISVCVVIIASLCMVLTNQVKAQDVNVPASGFKIGVVDLNIVFKNENNMMLI